MRLSVAGLWQKRTCTVRWEDGGIETQPEELFPLFRLHAWIRREGLHTREAGDADPPSGGLTDPGAVLDIARTLFDVILIVEDPLGAWTLDQQSVGGPG